tara:strand:- start:189 stop:512 length:324 start_codon:yes stop_codon:yes gene_type:complete
VPGINEKPARTASASAPFAVGQAPDIPARLTGYLAGGVLLAAALIITSDILLRWGISRPIKGLFEIMELVFACIVALAFTFANKYRMHVSMELVGNVTGGGSAPQDG